MSMEHWSVEHHWKSGVFLILSETQFEKAAMNLLIVLLSIVLVLNAAFLMLLILIQLPKKEAGAGVAFGGGATDALFGAGSGNALTKMTKYAAGTFIGLAFVLTLLNVQRTKSSQRGLEQELAKPSAASPAAKPP